MKFLKRLVIFTIVILTGTAISIAYLMIEGHEIKSISDVLPALSEQFKISELKDSLDNEESKEDFQNELFDFIKTLDNISLEEYSSRFMNSKEWEVFLKEDYREVVERVYGKNYTALEVDQAFDDLEKKVMEKIPTIDKTIKESYNDIKRKESSYSVEWSKLDLVVFVTKITDVEGLKNLSGEVILEDSEYSYKMQLASIMINGKWKLADLSNLEREKQ
jgi:hypothetical protein